MQDNPGFKYRTHTFKHDVNDTGKVYLLKKDKWVQADEDLDGVISTIFGSYRTLASHVTSVLTDSGRPFLLHILITVELTAPEL